MVIQILENVLKNAHSFFSRALHEKTYENSLSITILSDNWTFINDYSLLFSVSKKFFLGHCVNLSK